MLPIEIETDVSQVIEARFIHTRGVCVPASRAISSSVFFSPYMKLVLY